MGGQLRIRIRESTHSTPWFDYLLASPEEMASLAEAPAGSSPALSTRGEHVYVGVLELTGQSHLRG